MILFRLLLMLMQAVAIGEHDIYEDHLKLDASLPTPQSQFQANSRVSQDWQENMFGHRSGIGATGLGAAANGVRENGLQASATAYVYPGTVPPNPQDSWQKSSRNRYNVENW